MIVPHGVRVAVCHARIGAGRDDDDREASDQCHVASVDGIVELEDEVGLELGFDAGVIGAGERIQLSPPISPSSSIPPCTSIRPLDSLTATCPNRAEGILVLGTEEVTFYQRCKFSSQSRYHKTGKRKAYHAFPVSFLSIKHQHAI